MSRTSSQAVQATGAQRGAAGATPAARSSPFREAIGPANDAFEREADRIAEAVVRGGGRPIGEAGWSAAASAGDVIQRKCAECEEEEDEKIRRAPKEGAEQAAQEAPAPAPAPAEATPADATSADPTQAAAPASTTPATSLLVDDEVEAARGQMRKSDFLDTLRGEVCATVDGALAGTGRDSQGCPWIDHWFGYYAARSGAEVERALLRYAPEAAGARSAQDYIRAVTGRVEHSARTWAKTGEITGVPTDVPAAQTAGGEALDSFGGMFFKARPGGARQSDPVSVRAQLGSGQALPAQLRTRMETAFGANFGGVRLHTDAKGAQLSDGLNARAFTVGQHVAFGAGEFKPGSIGGDALIAHELAHVVQQGGADGASTMGKSPDSSARLEEDADRSAIGVVGALWGGVKGGAGKLGPALKSGLQLSRCSRDAKPMTLSPVTITVKQAAMALSQRGSAEYKVQWSVPAGKNGWVIQHVKFGGAIEDATGPVARANSDLEYWEGWQARNGSVYIGSGTGAHQSDTFRTISEAANTKGHVEVIGKVGFVEDYDLQEPPWGHSVAPAGALPTMTSAPAGWADGSAQDHTMKVDYDAITPTPQTQVGNP